MIALKTSLVGFTGFVGTNLAASYQFNNLYNSSNISDAYGTQPDLLVYSGVRAEMFLANSNPNADYSNILQAQRNIDAIKPKKLVLISTVAVYAEPYGVNEASPAGTGGAAYGINRHLLEKWVTEAIDDYCIIRLPAVFGQGLKKNFLYDYIHAIPSMLNEKKFAELTNKQPGLSDFYILKSNGFYCCRDLNQKERRTLKEIFTEIGFNALNFTDSRSIYQFYDLSLLWKHIQVALKNSIPLVNLVSEPVSVCELYSYLCAKTFENFLPKPPFNYDVKSLYSELFGGKNGYMLSRDDELKRIRSFVNRELAKF